MLTVGAGNLAEVTTYDAEDLTQWSSVTIYTGSIFMQRAVRKQVEAPSCELWFRPELRSSRANKHGVRID